MITDSELAALDRKGFIPGPNEEEETFLERVRAGQEEKAGLPREHWAFANELLMGLYGFESQSLAVNYSNEGLAWWHGAACWIDERGVARLQLREGFRKGSYLGLYLRGEVLAHEAAHAARAGFDELEMEEYFAYATSGQRWRRALGPIIKRPWEIWIWLGTMASGLFSEWGVLACCAVMGGAFWRLICGHLRLRRASDFLLRRVGDRRLVRGALFRMTDEEIRRLASGEQIEGDESLRWRLIRIAYITDAKGAGHGTKNHC